MGWPRPCGIRGPCLDQRVCSATYLDHLRLPACFITTRPQNHSLLMFDIRKVAWGQEMLKD